MKDERLVSKMEGKTNFFEAPETVWWLDLTDPVPPYLRQIYSTAVCHIVYCIDDIELFVCLVAPSF